MKLFEDIREKIIELEKKAHEIKISEKQLASMIDHTNLKPFATKKDIKKLVDEAIRYGFFGVCVNPSRVKDARRYLNDLKNDEIKVVSVVGFPLGATSIEMKVSETKYALNHGADEIDMVINIGAARENNFSLIEEEISSVVSAAENKPVKVIIETAYLTFEEEAEICKIAKNCDAAFVKTSTGFGPLGATPIDVWVMRKSVGKDVGVKAAGGIRNFSDAFRMIAAGATRLGTSRGPRIIESLRKASPTFHFDFKRPEELCPGCIINLSLIPISLQKYYQELCNLCKK